MNLKKISIENFKCFGKQIDIDFGRITLLTGANSSGKSSIIYAILGAIQSDEFPFQFSPNEKYVEMGGFKEFVHNHDVGHKIKLNFTFSGIQYGEIETIWENDKKSNLAKLTELTTHLNKAPFKIRLEKDRYLENWGNISKEVLISRENINSNPQQSDMSTVNSLVSAFRTYSSIVNFIGPFRQAAGRVNLEKSLGSKKIDRFGAGYLEQILHWNTNDNAELRELVRELQRMNLIYSFNPTRIGGGLYNILVQAKKGGAETPLIDVGSGVSQFLPIIVADLQLPNGSTLFVAEPETHLHPSVQSSIGDYLTNKIKTTSKNYVIETHSEYLLNKIRLAIVKGEIKEDDVSVLFLDNEGDENSVHKIGFKPNGQIANAPENFFKTYMMDVMEIAINAAE